MAADSAGLGLPISLSEWSAEGRGDDPMVAARVRRRRGVSFALPSLTEFDWHAAFSGNEDLVAAQTAVALNRPLPRAESSGTEPGVEWNDGLRSVPGPPRAPPASI